MLSFEIASAHREQRARLTERTVSRALRMWQQFRVDNLDLSWALHAEQLIALVTDAQRRAAEASTPYVNALQAADGLPPVGSIASASFSGVVLDGREVGPAMFGAVTTAKTLIGGGRPPAEAFTVAASFLATVVSSAVQDMGRQSDLVAGVPANRLAYIRVVRAGACSRCAILAGKRTSREGFLRHPNCQCGVAPVLRSGQVPDGFFQSPEEYFESLSPAEQDRVFTNAGAEAIRAGANPVKVVNARRGAYGIGYSGHYNIAIPAGTINRLRPVTIGVKPNGEPLQVFATTEGTTIRGQFGRREIALSDQALRDSRYRRTSSIRLMPEQIIRMAGSNEERLVQLLRRYGYLY